MSHPSPRRMNEVTKKGKGRPANKENIWKRFCNSRGCTPLPAKKYVEYCKEVNRNYKVPVLFSKGVVKVCKKLEDEEKYQWVVSKGEHDFVLGHNKHD